MIKLCRVDDIAEGASRGFELQGNAVFAVKKDNAVYVYHNRCPHLGVQLEWQEDQFLDPDGALIQCSTHGAIFLIEDGNCVGGPCVGASLTPVEHRIDGDAIYVTL